MATRKKVIKIPFDGSGHLMEWVGYSEDHSLPPAFRRVLSPDGAYQNVRAGEWRDNYEFEDVLTITGITRGRSAARFNLEGSDGTKYQMFMTDMEETIKRADIHKGLIAGTWTFQKRGSNYGIRLVK